MIETYRSLSKNEDVQLKGNGQKFLGESSSSGFSFYGKTPNFPRSLSRLPSGRSSSNFRKTPSISTTTVTPQALERYVIAAVVEGRGGGKGQIGIASIDFKNPELILSQFSDSQAYCKVITKLHILNPAEIIVPDSAYDKGMSVLIKQIVEELPGVSLTAVQRRYFSESSGLHSIQMFCLPDYNSVQIEISNKYYSLAAAAALLKYVEYSQNITYAPRSLKILFRGSEKTMLIDSSTAKHLELITNLRDSKSSHTLLGILQRTKTIAGMRLLRSNILQPPSDLDTIVTRLDFLTEFTKNEELFITLQYLLGRFLDVEHILSLCIQVPKQENIRSAEVKIMTVIHLKHVLELVEPLRAAVSLSSTAIFKEFQDTLEDSTFENLLEKIQSVIHDDIRYQKGTLNSLTQKCFAVKPNINGLLDVARRAYTETVDDISELIQQLAKQYNLPLHCTYSVARGFYIQLYFGGKNPLKATSLPSAFVKVVKSKNAFSFTTEDLIKLNDRIKESLNEIYLMSNIIVSQLLNDIRDQISPLYKLADIVSFLDMMTALAHHATVDEWVRPEFTDKLIIKNGRHPILEKSSVDQIVPNNTYLSEDQNFLVITGANMSGKSTYLKQVALLQIMAQIGSFIPAEYASFRITDQLFSRIGTNDDIESNSSAFMLQMKEANYILQNHTDKSLIIIDELGGSTNTDEGTGICFAICEKFLGSKCFTLFTTHFLQLADLEILYPNVTNFHFQAKRIGDGENSKVEYTHVLIRGSMQNHHYGLKLAEISSLPSEIVRSAKEVADKLMQNEKGAYINDMCWKRNILRLATHLINSAKNTDFQDSIQMYMSLQSKYKSLIPLNDEE